MKNTHRDYQSHVCHKAFIPRQMTLEKEVMELKNKLQAFQKYQTNKMHSASIYYCLYNGVGQELEFCFDYLK